VDDIVPFLDFKDLVILGLRLPEFILEAILINQNIFIVLQELNQLQIVNVLGAIFQLSFGNLLNFLNNLEDSVGVQQFMVEVKTLGKNEIDVHI
jgi:hypothetical protein